MSLNAKPLETYNRLFQEFGPQGWWPTFSEKTGKIEYHKGRIKKLSEKEMLEIAIGAILAQNTNWRNAEKAVLKLIENEIMDAEKIAKMKNSELEKLIRSSGYFRQKAGRLKIFCNYLIEKYEGEIGRMYGKDLNNLREELLSLYGIGQETADSIILYSAQQPSFAIDAYTFRLNEKFGMKKLVNKIHNGKYSELKEFFEDNLPKDVKLFQEYHALIVEWGKRENTSKTN